jgi:chitinase
VSLSAASEQTVGVQYATANGTATTENVDYFATSGTLTWSPGDTAPKTISVLINGDTTFEADESFAVVLSNPTNATIPHAQGTGAGTILNDDAVPPTIFVSINDITVAEGSGGASNATFAVTLSGPNSVPVSVVAQTTGGTANANADYTPVGPTTLQFPAGTTSQTFTVPIVGDTLDEPNETVVVSLTNPTNAALGKAQGAATIIDDDEPSADATLSIYDLSVVEGNDGPTPLTFTVVLSRATTAPVTVRYITDDGSATLIDGDFRSASGMVTFNPGELSKQFTVTVNGDTRAEGNETFLVRLYSATNANIATSQATATIIDDDLSASASCGPRPPVQVSSRKTGDGRLEVTVTAGTDVPNFTNRLTQIQFGAGSNALIDIGGQTGRTGDFAVLLSDRPTSLTFQVRRDVAGRAATVPLTVVDDCGTWPTFVGGGPAAF